MASHNGGGTVAGRVRSPQEADERIRELETQNTELRRMVVEMVRFHVAGLCKTHGDIAIGGRA